MKRLLASLALLFLFNAMIAVLVTVIGHGRGFAINLLASQCIGFTIGLVNMPLIPRLTPGWRRVLALAFSLPVSAVLGIGLAYLILGVPLAPQPDFWQSLVIGLIFAVLGSIVFMLAERIHHLDDEVRRRRLAEEAQARREAEAHLKLLQAQIEPHFLFNTLANVGSLIDSDPPRARRLLDRLNDWLRAALARTRGEQATLGDELALLDNWLAILAERFGPRLAWTVDADAEVRALPFPPMLLQPLVENAIRHGIEPKVGGGRLTIAARRQPEQLTIEVRDDGAGLAGASANPGLGTGLANVRDRLAALYGARARLGLRANVDGGTTATLELPCAP